MACKDTEIRKVKPHEIYDLAIILNDSDAWKKLMAIVPAEGNTSKFNNEHIRIIEKAAHGDKRNPAQIFLNEWSTMGRKRPTLGILLELLVGAELFRAADYVACNILKLEKPKRPDSGPAASIDTSDAVINDLFEKQQMHLQNAFDNDDPLLLASTSEINDKYFCEKNDINNENVKNVSDTSESSLNYHKSVTIPYIESDLMKFSPTNISEAENKHTECNFTPVSKHNSEEILSGTGNPGKSTDKTPLYGYEEVSSQELPVFIRNNPEQSATELNEEICSSDIPLCIKK